MTDSTKLSETGNVVANTPYEEKIPNEAKEQKTDSNENENNGTEDATNVDANAATDVNSNEPNNDENDAEAIDDEMNLFYLDKDFVYECMSVPTCSEKEYRLVLFIILWARRNGIKYEFDDFGNVYLTKGELAEGEFYPCVTSHLDTVQDNQIPYIYAGVPLDLIVEKCKDGSHKVSVDANGGTPIGIGADDKAGVCICLTMFKHIDKLKACFFLDEERGCHGSNALDLDWFKDVGYVIGYDSPDLYRAAWSCSGTKLFSYEFYEKHMKEVCDRWGLTSGCFFSEPYTDVKNIREKTDIICMNFGNGGYDAHSKSEYIILEDMEHACGMGVDLIKSIGNTEHKLKHYTTSTFRTENAFKRNDDGTFECVVVDDTEKLRSLGDNKRRTYSYGYGASHVNTSTTTTVTKKEEQLKFETIKYIVNRYDSHILAIKEEVLEAVRNLCEKANIKFDDFKTSITEKFSNEIKF